MTKMIYDFGFLDLIYHSKDLKEIENFDDIFKSEVSKYAQGGSIYQIFYSISPEQDGSIFYQADHIITVGYVGRNFQIEVGKEDRPVPKITKSWIKSRRILGIKVLYNIAKKSL